MPKVPTDISPCLATAGIYRAGSAGSAAAVISSADVEGGASNTSTRHTPPAQHNTSPAAAGIAGAKDVAVVSIQPRKKKRPKRLLWVAIPLVLLLTVAAVGLGVGLGVSKQQQQQRVAAAAAVANDSNQMLAFRVTVAVPTDQPAVSCAKWFGSSQVRHATGTCLLLAQHSPQAANISHTLHQPSPVGPLTLAAWLRSALLPVCLTAAAG